jgi:hypothetical protein
VPDRSGIGALPLPFPDPPYDLPKCFWEFVGRIWSRFGGTRLSGTGFAEQQFESARRLFEEWSGSALPDPIGRKAFTAAGVCRSLGAAR